jgi:oligopeptide transport system ATP-binding protein
MSGSAIVEVRDLVKHFPITQGVIFQRQVGAVKAVDGISFDIIEGETLGIVGETGCGKSTTARLLVRLLDRTSGEVRFEGEDIGAHKGEALKALHRKVQMIFQDPYSSLNPRLKIRDIIGEPLKNYGVAQGRALNDRVEMLASKVGLRPEALDRYPHEFSGGQRQRIGIARALALEPDFIVCDEAISALDVSIQAQVINLLRDLQGERALAYLFIAHDLSVVEFISDRVAVMYLGRIVETSDTGTLFRNPIHPYTKALFSAVPVPDPKRARKRILLPGDPPSPLNPPKGCRFHPRCPIAELPLCATEDPPTVEAEPGHFFNCHVMQRELRLPAVAGPAKAGA